MNKKETNLYFLITEKNKYSIKSLVSAIDDLTFPAPLCIINDAGSCFVNEGLLFLSFLTYHKEFYKEIICNLKNKRKNIKIVAGGPHTSGAPDEVLNYGADSVCVGEGEGVIKEIINDYLSSGLKKFYYGVPVDLDKYKSSSEKYGLYGPVEITRGCSHNCYFCQVPSLFQHKVRHRSIENIVESFKVMVRVGMRDLRMIAPDAFNYGRINNEDNTGCIEGLLKSIRNEFGKRINLFFGTFPSEIRPDSVTLDKVKILKEYTDTKLIVIGLQNASKNILEKINRKHTKEDVKESVQIFLKAGFKVAVDIIFGFPDETRKDREETILFCEKMVNLGVKIHCHYYMPLPGTELYKKRPSKLERDIFRWFSNLTRSGKAFGKLETQYKYTLKNYL
ncbi:MAG: TIGR04013 family B12-binding domain/radical SAM domain-containing protein [Candidatus Hydrogenedentota bacterium]